MVKGCGRIEGVSAIIFWKIPKGEGSHWLSVSSDAVGQALKLGIGSFFLYHLVFPLSAYLMTVPDA